MDPDLPRYPSIVHALDAATKANAEGLAMVCRERRLRYAELSRAVAGLARQLRRWDLQRKRVVVALPSGVEAAVSVLAVLAVGGQAVPVNPFFTPPELKVVLREADPDAVIGGAEVAGKLLELGDVIARARLAGFGTGDGHFEPLALDAWIGDESLALDAGEAPSPDELAVLIFTGGTTGVPKAVEHRHGSLMASLLQHRSAWPVVEAEERFLSSAPIFHVWGLFYATFVPIHCASTQIIVPRYDADDVLESLERHRVTVLGGGPAPVYLGLMQSPRFASTDFSSLKYCLSGGAPCPASLSEGWQRATGCQLLEGWGMSEAAPLCLNRPGEPHKPLSVGRAVPETEVEVVDVESGERVLGPGEPGEVRVRGPQLMSGYRQREEETRAVLRDGWLYTGDVGQLDEQGYLFLVDRKKDLVIVGGYNVYPRHVDEVLFQHPGVAEAACVGRADSRLGEVLVAFVVRAAGADLDEAELERYCTEQMVKYRRPVAFFFVEALPRTGARKIDRKRLREWATTDARS